MPIRVFNADDHPLLRKGITDLLQESPDMDWVGSAEDGREAITKIRALAPDVAILDIQMPFHTGLEVAQLLLEEGCATRFILLTLFKDETLLSKALDMGVLGYLLKESTEKEVLDCIHSVSRGQPYVNPSLTQYLIKQKQVKGNVLSQLSTQEINILKLIARQKTTVEIADMMFISPKTVANHRNNISKKLALGGEQNSLLKWAIAHKEALR